MPDNVLSDRVVYSRVDPTTGRTWHMIEDAEELTAEVRARLQVQTGPGARSEESVEKRLALYHAHEAEVAGVFGEVLVHRIDGDRHPEQVFNDICAVLEGTKAFNNTAGGGLRTAALDMTEDEATAAAIAEEEARTASGVPTTHCRVINWSLRDSWHPDLPPLPDQLDEVAEEEPDTGPKVDELVLLHFNDVYEIKEGRQEPVGGASRITGDGRAASWPTAVLTAHSCRLPSLNPARPAAGKIQEFRQGAGNPLVLFSGDALNPSLISQVTKGNHMIEVLNAMGVHCSVIGNHDLDFGVQVHSCLSMCFHCLSLPFLVFPLCFHCLSMLIFQCSPGSLASRIAPHCSSPHEMQPGTLAHLCHCRAPSAVPCAAASAGPRHCGSEACGAGEGPGPVFWRRKALF